MVMMGVGLGPHRYEETEEKLKSMQKRLASRERESEAAVSQLKSETLIQQELQDRLDILQDENESLRLALQNSAESGKKASSSALIHENQRLRNSLAEAQALLQAPVSIEVTLTPSTSIRLTDMLSWCARNAPAQARTPQARCGSCAGRFGGRRTRRSRRRSAWRPWLPSGTS
jgi:hypothetical protein